MPAIGDEKLQGVREPRRHSRVGQGGEVSTERTDRGVPGGSGRRPDVISANRTCALGDLQIGQPANENEVDKGLADARVDDAGAANSEPRYLTLCLEDQAAQAEITQSATIASGAFGASFMRRFIGACGQRSPRPPTSSRHEPWRRPGASALWLQRWPTNS